jgi:5'-3' exonuclease
MGIPYYVASLLRKNKSIQQHYTTFEADAFGIDFNCFIHAVLDDMDPVGSIVRGLREYLERITCPRIFVAFDGLVPYAKIVQQRYRRFKSPEKVGAFDRHQISPETPYMVELVRELRVAFPHVTFSGTDEHGEGEHKVFLWLRSLEPDCRKRIAVYGLDADLVLIALAQRSLGDLYLLRDDDAFSIGALAGALPMDVDTYVQTCILCFGNDFMPTLAFYSLREDGHSRALKYGIDDAAKHETRILLERRKPGMVSKDGRALEAQVGAHLLDGVVDWAPVCDAFWKTFKWTEEYFTTSRVPDWCWVYPYAEAPLIQTLADFSPKPYEIQWEHPTPPFHVTNQLQCILPQASLKTARRRVRYPDEIYDESKDTRYPWMKRFAWETDPYISVPWHPCYPPTSVSEVVLPKFPTCAKETVQTGSLTSPGRPRGATRSPRSS